MTLTKSLLAASAFAALMAVPSFALEIGADAKLGAAPEDMTTMKMVEDSAFVGNEVRTKDQIVIGQVENVFEGTDGAPVVMVTLNSDVASKSSVKSFTVPLASDMTADGSLTLGWNEAELFTALSGNLEADMQSGDGATDGTSGAASD